MKKLILSGLLLASAFFVQAQKKDSTTVVTFKTTPTAPEVLRNNELKLNLLYSIIGIPEISYERLLGENMGVGAAISIGATDDTDYKFGFVPYYRIYFGAKRASGFFIEANAGIFRVADYNYNYDYLAYTTYPAGYTFTETKIISTNFGLGAAVGGKFLTKNGFVGEAYLGLGRFFGSENTIEAYPRIGITIGKQF